MTGPFTVSRRTTLTTLSAAAAASAMPALGNTASPARDMFRHGVASGDPDATSVVLWTRISGVEEATVAWEVASDPGFRKVAASGQFATGAERDFTVKALAEGLKPGAPYYYRFRCKGVTSPVGRTRTLPVGPVKRLGIALASCSNFAFGHFNAYDAIARDPAVDFVLHTGDYIYEYGADGWGGEISRKLGRVHQPSHEIVSLSDYRIRHAQYKSDAGAQTMHAAKPLLACWDDHESANNPWVGGAQNHQPETEGSWADRRNASIQAYYEWMPVREPGPGRTRAQFWRTYVFGDLATQRIPVLAALAHQGPDRPIADAAQPHLDHHHWQVGRIEPGTAEQAQHAEVVGGNPVVHVKPTDPLVPLPPDIQRRVGRHPAPLEVPGGERGAAPLPDHL